MVSQVGGIKRGIVTGYDPATMTAQISPYDNSGIISNVVCSFTRYDPVNGAYAVTPPSLYAPCLYTEAGGETFILSTFPPANVESESNASASSTIGGGVNRTPADMDNSNTLPGNSSATNALGAEESFTDSMKKLVLAPGKLESIWNMVNFIWENICGVFRLESGAMDVYAETDTGDCCNVTINMRKSVGERGGTAAVNLIVGNDADVITLSINGTEFLHIDEDRNVTITSKELTLNATNIIYNADDFNCQNVGTVELP